MGASMRALLGGGVSPPTPHHGERWVQAGSSCVAWLGCLSAAGRDVAAAMPSLRELRAARLLSIRELAHRAQVAPSTIYLIEAGRTTPRPRVIRQLAAVLGVEPTAVDEFRQAIERAAQHRPGLTGP